MTDRDFDLLLEESIAEIPPTDDLVEEITPWRKAVNRILWGMALCGITLNFLLLDHILPTIGLALMLLGFRSLRRENSWFLVGYGTAMIRMAIRIITAVVNATIWQAEVYDSAIAPWLTAAGVILPLVHALCLWGGFRAVQEKAGAERSSRGFWLVVYYVILTVLALVEFQGLLVVLGLLAIYIMLLRSLWKYSHYLEDVGYTVQASPVRLSDRALGILLAAVIAMGITCGYLFCNQYPMEWTEQDGISAEADAVKTELLELGFPEYVLNDLTEEDLLACQGAAAVYVQTDEAAVNDGKEVAEFDGYATHIYTEYPVKELLITHVVVQPEDGEHTWKIFHHFLWQVDPIYRSTEAIQIWPAYQKNDGWAKGSHLSGQVLYNRGEITYTAPYQKLEEMTYTGASFFGTYESTDIMASYSLPFRGEKCRGYVCYDAKMAEEGWLLSSWCNYFYSRFPQYPLQTAIDFAVPGSIFGDNAFKLCQTAIQMWPSEEGTYEIEE